MKNRIIPILLILFIFIIPPIRAQDLIVSGTVRDEWHQILENVLLRLPYPKVETVTNSDGIYTLVIPSQYLDGRKHQLFVHKAGFVNHYFPLVLRSGKVTHNIILKKDSLRVDHFFTAEIPTPVWLAKEPFAIGSLDEENVRQVSGISPFETLKGKIPGVMIINGNGTPGTDLSIQVRGSKNLTLSNAPLVIMDGTILGSSQIDIDGQDVVAIEVLKGSAGAAIFGSRGANGVIFIHSHLDNKPASDGGKVQIRNEIGFTMFPGKNIRSRHHSYKLTTNKQYFADDWGNPIQLGDGWHNYASAIPEDIPEKSFRDNPFPAPVFDQFDQFFESGFFQTSRVEFTRRNAGNSLFTSLGYTKDPGIIKGMDGFRRRNIGLNLSYAVFKNLQFRTNLYYVSSWRDDPVNGTINPFQDLLSLSAMANLNAPDDDGTDFKIKPDPKAYDSNNPLYLTHNQKLSFNRERFMGFLDFTWRLKPWLNLNSSLSYDRLDRFDEKYYFNGFKSVLNNIYPDGHYQQYRSFGRSLNYFLSTTAEKKWYNLRWIVQGQYQREINGIRSAWAGGDNLIANNRLDIDAAKENISVHSSREDVNSEGVSLQTYANYAQRYFVDFALRYERCSSFGLKVIRQTFGRAALGWQLSAESWWPIDAVQNFYVHYAVGSAGTRPPFSARYERLSAQEFPEKLYRKNDFLKPSLTLEHETGFSALLFRHVSFSLVYAWSVTKNQILSTLLPNYYGFKYQFRNAGAVRSRNFEGELHFSLLHRKQMDWSVGIVFDRYRQKITELEPPPHRAGMIYLREAESPGAIYGSKFLTSKSDIYGNLNPDCFDKNDEGYLVPVGEGKTWRDGPGADGRVGTEDDLWGTKVIVGATTDGVPVAMSWGIPTTYNGREQIRNEKIGDVTPDFNLGFHTSFSWKGFSFYTALRAQIGGDVYNNTRQWMYLKLIHKDCDQFGKPEMSKKPDRYYSTLYNFDRITGTFVENAGFLKLQDLSLKYSFSHQFLQKFFGGVLGNIFGRLTLGIVGRNLITITRYSGFDPEVGVNDATIMRKDSFGYPPYRTLSGVIELEF